MRFLLQVNEDCKVTLDQCFQIERAKEYWDWRNKSDSFDIVYGYLDEDEGQIYIGLEKSTKALVYPELYCPIGTIEFVQTYIKNHFGDEVLQNFVKPLNVPDCLLQYAHRTMFNLNKDKDSNYPKRVFVKDNDRIKNPDNGEMTLEEAREKFNNFQCSAVIDDIASEWRVFIHNGQPIDCKNYSGDPFIIPDREYIDECAKMLYSQGLTEVTLDVCVRCGDYKFTTDIIEVHHFYSCGLYGFSDNSILPIMYWRTFKKLIRI